MIVVSPEQTKLIAEICILKRQPLKVAMQATGLTKPEVSMVKNSHLAHLRAIDLLCEQNQPLLKRITKKKIRQAVALHVNQLLTTDEIDEQLALKSGTCKMLTRSPVFKVEKHRLEKFGKAVYMGDA